MSNIGFGLWMRENKDAINKAKQEGEHIFLPARRLWKELSEDQRYVRLYDGAQEWKIKALQIEENNPAPKKQEQIGVTQLPLSRVKKLFEHAKEGKEAMISRNGVKALAIATECFLKELVLNATETARERKRKVVKLDDLQQLSKDDLRFRFIQASRFLENIREIETEMKLRAEQELIKRAAQIEQAHQSQMKEMEKGADKEEHKLTEGNQ